MLGTESITAAEYLDYADQVQVDFSAMEANLNAGLSGVVEDDIEKGEFNPALRLLITNTKRDVERIIARAKVLRQVLAESEYSIWRVAFDLDNPAILAFVTVSDKTPYIAESTLDDLVTAVHAAKHECNHLKNGVLKLPANREVLGVNLLRVLADALEVDVFQFNNPNVFIEGYTEWATILEKGKCSGILYNKFEVPTVQKLELLAWQHLGASLLDVFQRDKLGEFQARLKTLALILARERGANLRDFLGDGQITANNVGRAEQLYQKQLDDAA